MPRGTAEDFSGFDMARPFADCLAKPPAPGVWMNTGHMLEAPEGTDLAGVAVDGLLGEAQPEALPSPDGHPESLEAWLPAREAWVEEGADRDGPPRRGRHARTWQWEEAAPLEAGDRPTLRIRAPLVPEAAPPASVMFRATAVLGMALGLMTAVLAVLGWHP
jgi:hypothetical protein